MKTLRYLALLMLTINISGSCAYLIVFNTTLQEKLVQEKLVMLFVIILCTIALTLNVQLITRFSPLDDTRKTSEANVCRPS